MTLETLKSLLSLKEFYLVWNTVLDQVHSQIQVSENVQFFLPKENQNVGWSNMDKICNSAF